MQRIHSIAAAIALACAAPLALAQTSAQQHPQSGAVTHTPPFHATPAQPPEPQTLPSRIPQSSTSTTTRQGQHDMRGTVQSVSSKDIVELKTDDGMLKLHFPDAKNQLKKGEEITVHLSYTVDSNSATTDTASSM